MTTNELDLVPLKCRKFVAGERLAAGFCLKEILPFSVSGVVWLASDPDLEKDLVLHFLPDSVAGDPRAMEELKQEVRRNRQLVHPRILRFYDMVEGDGWVALAMDFTGGETLAQLLKRKKFFECKELKEWVGQICTTIDDGHKSDLLHRNISPENIQISSKGELVVANFGVSRVILDSLNRTALKDQKERKEAKYTKPDDIYAIGVLIYQLLTGTPPFAPDAVEPEGLKESLTPVSVRRKELGIKGERILPEWEKTIAMCLEKKSSLRPKSAIEIVMRLGGQRPLTETASPAIGAKAKGQSVAMGALAIRSTVKPGGKAGFESDQEGPVLKGDAPDSGVGPIQGQKETQVPAPQPKKNVQPSKPTGRKHQANVFMPFQEPLSRPRRTGPPVALGLLGLLLLGISGGAYFYFSGGTKINSKTELVSSPAKDPAPTEIPTPPSPESQKIEEPTPTPPVAKVDLPEPTPAPTSAPVEQPQPPVVKVMVEPQSIPEEDSPLFKAAKAKPGAIEAARIAFEANERVRQEKVQVQEKALAELKEAQAAAEKANAEMLLKQAAAGDAGKSVTDVVLDGEQKRLAIRDAEAEAARFQAVMAQIRSLKKERAVETEVPALSSGTGAVLVPAIADGDDADSPENPSQTPTAPAAAAPKNISTQDLHGARENTNSLGMKFAPVGDVKFSVWLTRVQDYEAFAAAVGARVAGSGSWKQPGFSQDSTHPVVKVSWKEATAFCKWLTSKERKEGALPSNFVYRLPTDSEWSQAVGLPYEKGRTAQSRDMDVPGVYPWGTQWPPPAGSGNYTGEETGSDVAIKGYNDGFPWTSPVGAFKPNPNGLYDMGGNAFQWCMDWWNEEQKARVLRGSSWSNSALNLSLLSSCRLHAAPESSADNYGFRCVIAPEGFQ